MRSTVKNKIFFFILLFSIILFTPIAFAEDCVNHRPTVSVSPKTLSGPAGATVLYQISIKNEDTKICAARAFTITVDAPGLSFFVNPSSLTILPTETGSALLSVTSPSDSSVGVKKITVAVTSDTQLSTDSVELNIIQEPKTCQVFVNNVEFIEEGSISPRTDFCTTDRIKIKTDVSLVGGTTSSVNVNSYVNNQLFDSKILTISPGSSSSFVFDRVIDSKALGLFTASVKVEAKTICDADGYFKTESITFKSCGSLCEFSSSVIAPSEATVSREIEANILFKNKGVQDNTIRFYPYFCKEDICKEIDCGEKTLSISGNSFKNFFCKTNTTETGKYQFKLETFSCGKMETTFSNTIFVNPIPKITPAVSVAAGACEKKILDEYTCVGNIRKRAFQNSDCSKTFSDVEFCPFGCSSGVCSLPTAVAEQVSGKPEILLGKEYEVDKYGLSVISFDIKNSGPLKDSFKIEISGSASGWIKTDSVVDIGANEQKTLVAYISVPQETKGNKYDFTISAKSKNLQSAVTSSINFVPKQKETPLPNSLFILSSILLVIVFIFIFSFRKRILRGFKEKSLTSS